MKTVILCLVLALLVATGASAVTTATATVPLYFMLNQIACPLVPLDPAPLYEGPSGIAGVFGGLPGQPELGWTDLYMGSDSVKKVDPTTGSEKILLSEWGADEGCLAGDGYIAWVEDFGNGPSPSLEEPAKTFQYVGVDISDTDLWVSLPGLTGQQGGDHWVGITYPIGSVIDYSAVVVTDGTDSYTMYQIASGEGPQDWMNPAFIYLEPTSQSERPVPWEWDPVLYGGQMYRVTTYKSNLALIIPHP